MTSRVPVLIVHGGAGPEPVEGREELRAGIYQALTAGWQLLSEGGGALDAIEAAVRSLEVHPRFNAGRGAVLTRDGGVELDASIMEGDRLRSGAVGAVTRIAHPVSLARRILEDGRHVLLVAEGALAFAREQGFPECDPAELITDRQLARWKAPRGGGTVGAVALDRYGTVAAATSTGGTAGKLPGRVGDSALIGCGTYAESTLGGVSCTGSGEAIIRVVLARRVLEILKALDNPERAGLVAMDVLTEEGQGDGGLIVLDWRGRTAFAHSTAFMPVGWINPSHPTPVLPF
ncbi:MAG: isoaspartyl peptidase/L-asparaginase [Candidatus Rokubacteria bacterium]|nr:isoaspartyl peptidase/L-asparaginase [Candidatus Rokubacteria bacterium]